MATNKAFKVGVIIGSQRVVRVGPQITNFVLETIKAADKDAARASAPAITFDVVDIKTLGLPFFDEPHIPQQIQSAEGYANEHTRAWSRRVAGLDAFIFVTPQRNWGIPAELKNAIDYLFHEWKGKPAMIVSYGGHGGTQSASQLKTVLGSIGMRVGDKMVAMAFPSADFRVKCFKGQELGLDANNDADPWAKHKTEIISAWDELVEKLVAA